MKIKKLQRITVDENKSLKVGKTFVGYKKNDKYYYNQEISQIEYLYLKSLDNKNQYFFEKTFFHILTKKYKAYTFDYIDFCYLYERLFWFKNNKSISQNFKNSINIK